MRGQRLSSIRGAYAQPGDNLPQVATGQLIEITTEGREAGELSGTILMDFLGVGVGAGLGGASGALADADVISLEAGIAGAFGVGLVAALLLAFVARRVPDARPVDSAA